MNSWGPDYYQQGNMMGMPPQPLMQNPMPMPPMGMMGDMNPPGGPPLPMIGPVKPDDMQQGNNAMDANEGDQDNRDNLRGQRNRDRKSDSRRDRDRSRHQGSDGSHDRNSRNDDRSGRNDNRFNRNDRNRRDRSSKWDSDKDRPALLPAPGQPPLPSGPGPIGPMSMGPMGPPVPLQPPPVPINAGPPGNMGMPGPGPGMMPYNNMNNMMGPNMDMSNMSNMPNMMPGMPGMMPGMPNMMDQNQMMMMNMMMMQQQALYITNAVLLPPLPGASLPNRRERPINCRTIFVGGLPEDANEETVRDIFQKFGNLTDVKQHRQGIYHVRFESPDSVEATFILSGYRFRFNNQSDNEATTVFIDYCLNREDQAEYEQAKRNREPTPPRAEPYSSQALTALIDKIKSDEQFYESAPTLVAWMERGECNKKNANTFYSLIQTSNNHTRRLFCEKMALDEEYQNLRNTFKTKFQKVVVQFMQVEKILSTAKHQRVSDHFTKQQRRNIEMWLKMTEEVENIKEEFNANFNDEELEKLGKETVSTSKYEALKAENESLSHELETYKNEANLAKNEAEMKFEKFKAQFIAQQALQTGTQGAVYPPLPPPPPLPKYPAPTMSQEPDTKFSKVAPSEARLVSLLTAFLLAHPLGASFDYLVSYVRSMIPHVSQEMVNQVLNKFPDVFSRKVSGVGNRGQTWAFVTFDYIKGEK